MTLKTLTHNCAIVILVNVKDVRGDNIIINLKRCNFRKYYLSSIIRSVDILWRSRSRVSKDKHLEGCIKTLRGSSLVGGGGGGREAGWVGGEGVQVLKHRKASTEKV